MTWKEKIGGAYAEHKKKKAYKRAAEAKRRLKGKIAEAKIRKGAAEVRLQEIIKKRATDAKIRKEAAEARIRKRATDAKIRKEAAEARIRKRATEAKIRLKGQAAYYRAKDAQTVRYQKHLAREQVQRKIDAEKQRTKTAKKQGGQAQSLFTGTRSALVNFATKPHTGMGMGSSSSYSMASTMGSTDYKIPMMGSTTSRPKVTTRKKKKPRKRGITINL
jgi:hypothetical protein